MTDASQTGADVVIKALIDQGVEVVFGYPGGAVLPIYDSLFKQNSMKHVLVRKEGGAAHAAEGYARSTGKVGVVLVTSGPGATNVVTGLTDAMMDSIPLVCLTGQVPTHLIGNDAFQEADTTGITRPCTKHNYLVRDGYDLARVMHEAFYVAASGRPGPVVVDLPKDVLQKPAPYTPREEFKPTSYRPRINGDDSKIRAAVKMIAEAKRPIFYGGGGLVNAGPEACDLFTEFAKITGYPVTNTLMGLGAFPAGDKQFVGMLGMHGTWEANWAMHDCDVMINIGARFDDRVTGRVDAFSPGSRKIHVDIDASSINKNVRADIGIVGDAGAVLRDMLRIWHEEGYQVDRGALATWWQQIEKWRSVDSLKYDRSGPIIKPQYAIERLVALSQHRGDDVYITTEVGQHQMWAAQFIPFNKPGRWMTSGGLGTMGYGLPAAIGVQIAHPDALVVDVAGEASILMNIQEMATAVQYRLPVKVFVLNNQWMGMVRQWQELLHGERYSESYSEALPDFVKMAEAWGWVGLRAENTDQLDEVIKEMIDTPRPVFVDVCVDQKENCFPMIPSGQPHNKMLLGPMHKQQDTGISEDGLVLV